MRSFQTQTGFLDDFFLKSLCTVRKINLLPRLILGDSVSQSFAICVIVDRNSLDLKLVTCVPAKIKNNNLGNFQKKFHIFSYDPATYVSFFPSKAVSL